MNKNEFKTATWECATEGCLEKVSQRFHVPTDGDPEKAAPPEPWTFEVGEDVGRLFFCPRCSAVRRAEKRAAEIPAETTFDDCADDEEILETWEREHRCLICENADLCRFVPQDNARAFFVTVSRCLGFVFAPDRGET